MPVHRNEKVSDRKQQLIDKIAECETVVRQVEGSEGWKIILKDIDATNKRIDENWFKTFDDKVLNEFRVTKFAVMQLLNTINTYKSDLDLAKKEMYAIDNPNSIINSYYDSENPNYEK